MAHPRARLWGIRIACLALCAGACASAEREADRPYTGGLARVDDVRIHYLPLETSFVTVTITGSLPDPCTRIHHIDRNFSGSRIEVTVTTRREAGAICAQVVTPFEHTFQLDLSGLDTGLYSVVVNGVDRPVTLEGGRFDDPIERDPLLH